jgi:hypothetical protein
MKIEQSRFVEFPGKPDGNVDALDDEFTDKVIVGSGWVAAHHKSIVSPRKRSPEQAAITLHKELAISPTWRANCQMVRSEQPTGVLIPVV